MTARSATSVMATNAMLGVCAAACIAASACRPADAAKGRGDSAELAKREARLERALAKRDSGATSDTDATKPVARWIMPVDLAELSGFGLLPDGRLLAHGDEHAKIYEIDYRRGTVVKEFTLGKPAVKGDFEAMATVGDRIYLLDSNGSLYEFQEGKNGERVEYSTHDTKLGKECEFEGLAYDPAINSLLLACKHVREKQFKKDVLIYRWPVEKDEQGERELSRLTVPLSSIPQAVLRKGEFHPSDIAIDPITGNYIILASIEKALMSITPSGQVVFARELKGEHDQAEALAITKDSILIIGDEAAQKPAVITLYRWP
jgi:uncharacterized protein YjiK